MTTFADQSVHRAFEEHCAVAYWAMFGRSAQIEPTKCVREEGCVCRAYLEDVCAFVIAA